MIFEFTDQEAEFRCKNLRNLALHYGGQTKLARLLGYKTPSFLSQMAGPRPTREMSEKTARTFEAALGIPSGYLDKEPGTQAALGPPTIGLPHYWSSAKRAPPAQSYGAPVFDMNRYRQQSEAGYSVSMPPGPSSPIGVTPSQVQQPTPIRSLPTPPSAYVQESQPASMVIERQSAPVVELKQPEQPIASAKDTEIEVPTSVDLVLDVIRLVGKVCGEVNLNLGPVKFADVVAMAYSDAAETGGKVREAHLRQVIKLMRV